ETVARLLGLRTNHPIPAEHLERQLDEPASRAEAAYSLARVLALEAGEVDALRRAVKGFAIPALDPLRQEILRRALRLVGSPYVWGGASERPQEVGGRLVPGGFDCSGLVWRVFKLEPLPAAPALAATLRGRTSYAMSGEVRPEHRVPRSALEPGDVIFFGPRGPRSRPSEIGHMGIYVGNGWFVHSSRNGTTLQPLVGWYEQTFAWGRRLLVEAGLEELEERPRGRTEPVPSGGLSTLS
ncbi:MAG: C40 family peptidase, partial [Thermoleophilia bacterium]|nr:C40 family peptidase [Gaiellaceae bacterium]MDW8338574.1 C40 family peptidase [Thermoleophilia bacterium]